MAVSDNPLIVWLPVSSVIIKAKLPIAINTTQEALFTPITKIDKLNAPIIEQPQQIDSRVTPIREIIYEVPRVENRYIIANDNPYQNINRLNFLYEDFIPDPLMPDKILTINDRFNLGEFISNNVLSLFEKETDKYYLGKDTH